MRLPSRRKIRVLIVGGAGAALAAGVAWAAVVPNGAAPQAASYSEPAPTVAGASAKAPSPRAVAPPSPQPEPPRPPATDPLTGGRPSDAEVLAVKIENTAAARPQIGLAAADVVVVEEVEAGLTRLIALYHSEFPRRVGPVRSARNTDVQLLPMFGRPGLVYSGANHRVQRRLDQASILPLSRSTRDPGRAAPHNVVVNLEQIAASQEVGRARTTGWTFAASDPRWTDADRDDKVLTTVGADRFTFAYGDGRYLVRWRGQSYGEGARAARTDNVVVLSVRNRRDGNADVNGSASVLSETVGRGEVTLYRDGRRLMGTWSRSKISAPMRFRDGDGRDLPLAPGKTWLVLRG